MNDEHSRCFWPYFAPFVIQYPYGSWVGLELFEPFENFLSPCVVVVHKLWYYVHKNGMSDEHLRCFWPYFAPFVVHFHMVHR